MAISQFTQLPLVPQEEWRPVVGYEGWYEVSDIGRVRRVCAGHSTHAGRMLKATPDRYLRIAFTRHGVTKRYFLHQVVAAAFLGPCPEGHQVNHKDLNKLNTRVDNLEYMTPAENSRHAWENGANRMRRVCQGMAHPSAKLTDEIARAVYSSTEPIKTLARRHGVAPAAIRAIRRGQAWRSVTNAR